MKIYGYTCKSTILMTDRTDIDGFNRFLAMHKAAFSVEKTAVEVM